MQRLVQLLFFRMVVRPIVLVILGLNVRHRERLPRNGPAILVANHNSHLDTVVLMTLVPRRLLRRVRPVAAADYFLSSAPVRWFALNVMNIIPLERHGRASGTDPLADVHEALGRGDVIILFPEGSRGEPERLADFKSGISRLQERWPEVPVIPVFLHALGKVLPKGAFLPVPFFCDVVVGEPLAWIGDRKAYMAELKERMQALASECQLAVWE